MNEDSVNLAALDDFMEAVDKLIPDTHDEWVDVGAWTLDEPFDKEAFLGRMMGDTQLAGEVAGLFLSHSQELVSAIGKAAKAKDFEAMTGATQSLKGSVAIFGASAVLDSLRELEKSGQAKDWAAASRTFKELENQVLLLSRSLEAGWGVKQPRRIVIAEDDPVSRRLLQAALAKWGHEPIVCVDGAQALAVFQQPNAPKIAILDWMMPGLDGVQVCRELRKKGQAHYVYVILLTGKDRTDDIIEGLDAGADDYVIKPFDPVELRGRLGVAFRSMDVHPGSETEEESGVHPPRDPATGLLTRRGILVLLKRHIGRVQTKGKPLGVILAETNEYRTTKETHGNAVADGLLKTIADRVGALIGSQDLVGRYEDDRMLLLLPDKGRDEVIEIAQGIRSVVEAGPVTIQGVRIPVRLSIGATVVTGQNRIALETAILAAENALADAKQGASATVGFAAIKASSIPAPAVETPKPSPASKLDLELIVAARAGNVKRVKGLLHSGANVDARDNRGNTALIEAAFFKYPDLVKLLLDSGADIDAGNNAGDTALTEAVRAGHDEVVNLLLSKWNPSSLEGESTPLYRALVETSSYGNTDVVTTVRDYLSRHGYGKQT